MKNYRAEVTIRYRNGAQIQDDVTVQASNFELAVRRAVSKAMRQTLLTRCVRVEPVAELPL